MRKIAMSLLFFTVVFLSLWVHNGIAQDELKVSLARTVGEISFVPFRDNAILASVLDSKGEAIVGLTQEDFIIKKGPRTAQILSVQDYAESKETGLNIVLVVDNSYSMQRRKAVEPLLEAIQSFLALVRPIDNVHVVVFTDPKMTGDPATSMVSTKVFQSSDVAALNQFLRASFSDTTDGTYLYDAMVKGLNIVHQMPPDQQKFMVVFSDGEDINSRVTSGDVGLAAQNLDNFSAYAIDYMDKPRVDPFLESFAIASNGEIRKARSANDFASILKSFSSTIFHRYIVSYRFINPPEGSLSIDPGMITVDEITIVDSSPLLNYIYFDTGGNTIPSRYISLAGPEGTGAFAEDKLQGTMEKYQNVLNVIGNRMVNYPAARLYLLGCISDTGVEKNNTTLARNRAEAVNAYLKDVWRIDPGRMVVKSQKLPSVPSTMRVPEGVVENQRVEISADDMAILDTVKSTYFEQQVDTKEVRVHLSVRAEAGVKNWQVTLLGDGKPLVNAANLGEPPASVAFSLESLGVNALASIGQISARLEGTDNEGTEFTSEAGVPTTIKFIKREERIAQKMGYRVIERYALILFEFDRAEIKQQNQNIMNRIITRIKELPPSQVQIIGHTDIIGTEKYNLTLSERRAKAAYDLIMSAGLPAGTTAEYKGVGPYGPPYDNALPEGRAYNRTVVITVNYETTGM